MGVPAPLPAPPATIPTGGTHFPCLVCTGIAGGEQLSTSKTSLEPSHVLNTDPQIPAELGGDAGGPGFEGGRFAVG